MNDPLIALVSTLKNGGNIRLTLQQLAASNPQVRQAMQMINGKSPDQLRMMAENMAKERGVSVNDMLMRLGLANPSNR